MVSILISGGKKVSCGNLLTVYGTYPSLSVLDAQVNYKLSALRSMVKVGATNLGGGDYRTNLGAPFVGQMYYISLTFDEFLR
ncbi:MAG: hypothetical protein U5K54_17255 [Cytophagales bacterium]|nr:hypothetical protein [Cytophagales bacterium]